jgi:putative PIN family toxin of toxin-antitoxin system
MAIVFSRLLVYLAFFPTFSRTKYRHFWHGNQGNPLSRWSLQSANDSIYAIIGRMVDSRVILDSNVLVSAFTSAEGASRQVLRSVLNSEADALISVPLFAEYESVLGRPETRRRCPLTISEQGRLFDAFLSRTQLVEVYYRWRPNLPDEGDNHILELAVAAGDAPIVTYNRRDFRGGQLRFPSIIVETPAAWLKSRLSY